MALISFNNANSLNELAFGGFMKSFLTSLKRQSGFTLVELMVVVAIIGLLSAVAVPNFKKYQAKAKVAEAKLQLSAAYTAEQAFYSDFGLYAHCLAYMGYNPSGEVSSRYFAVGFHGTANRAVGDAVWDQAINSGLSNNAVGGCQDGGAGLADGYSHFDAGKGVGVAIIGGAGALAFSAAAVAPCAPALGTQATQADQTFTIAAAGIIEGSNVTATASACLTMSETKTIRQARAGY